MLYTNTRVSVIVHVDFSSRALYHLGNLRSITFTNFNWQILSNFFHCRYTLIEILGERGFLVSERPAVDRVDSREVLKSWLWLAARAEEMLATEAI